jgi:hypothetical protein
MRARLPERRSYIDTDDGADCLTATSSIPVWDSSSGMSTSPTSPPTAAHNTTGLPSRSMLRANQYP